MPELFAGIDVGGTSIKWLIVDAQGTPIAEDSARTQSGSVEEISAVCAQIVDDYPEIIGIGVVTPGTVDEAHGIVGFASNLILSHAPLAQAISEATNRPTKLGHDGRGAGLAERLFGAASGSSSLVVPIGTGISAAICVGEEVWAGSTFQAGEIGHIPIYPDGEACACGQRGCLEVYASAKGIKTRYRALTGVERGTREIENRLDSDEAAGRVWHDATQALALVFTHLTLALDPASIVIAGGLSGAGAHLTTPVEEGMRSLLAWREPPAIYTSLLGNKAGRWGAAVLAARAATRECYRQWKVADAQTPTR